MRKISVFNNVSIDGYFADKNSDMSWAHQQDEEFSSFVQNNAKGDAEFLFGRVTYEMMASFWPTPFALEANPIVAKQMNSRPKYVFSHTLSEANWNNTKLIKGDLVTEVKKLKSSPGPDIVIFGSGTIVSQLAQAKLIDQYQFVIAPIVLGAGKNMFDGLKEKQEMKLVKSHIFKNGIVFLIYEP